MWVYFYLILFIVFFNLFGEIFALVAVSIIC